MKEFRKTPEGLFVCEECRETFNNIFKLSYHVGRIHKNSNEYHDKWIKEENEGVCKICSKDVKFISIGLGYENGCCKEHKLRYIDICAKLVLIEKYGGPSAFYKKETHEKSKQTLIERYGVEHNFKIEGAREGIIKTWNKTLGVDNPSQSEEIKRKKEKTCLKNNGVKAGFCNIEKRQLTCRKHYGVSSPSQNKEIFEKQQKSGYLLKYFKDTNIYYRGKYEEDFLEKYYVLFPDLINAPSIKYLFQDKEHWYHPDFYIKTLNLIVEIKNSYLARIDKEKIEAKKQATLNKGYNYIMIVNKDYDKFNILINEKNRV